MIERTRDLTRAAVLVLASAALACGSGDDGDGKDTGADDAGTDAMETGMDVAAEDVTVPVVDELTVMTFNVLCSFCDPAYDPWEDRLDYQADIIARHDPDLLGLQEFVFASEVDQYLAKNPGYAAIYYVSDDPESPLSDYPDATILYRESRFDAVEQGFFWLSPTPDVPFSLGFLEDGGQLWRLVVWALLEQKADGRRFYFATTHFDPNPPSQDKSGPLVYDRFAQMVAQHPFIFTGDYNTHPGDTAYANLVDGVAGHDWHFTNTWDTAKEWEIVTNLGPVPDYDFNGVIDHVFTAGGTFECDRWRVDMTVYGLDDKLPSDHLAISADIRLP